MRHRVLQLDPSGLALTAQGIDGYYLPVSRTEILAIRNALLQRALLSARAAARDNQTLAPLASSAFLNFVAEFLSVAEASLLFTRTRAVGGSISLPGSTTDYWDPIASGRAPAFRRMDARLAQTGPKRWKAPLRVLRRFYVNDGIERLPIDQIDLSRDTVAISVGGLISRQARTAGRRVAYLPLTTWFGPVGDAAPLNTDSARLVEGWIDDCRSAMSAIGELLPDYLLAYLHDWLSLFFSIAEAHRERLARRPDLLPRQLWIGAGSQPLIRLLAHAVRDVGGEVTGHDHATGYGHMDSELKDIVDFWTCDTFVTFTEEGRRALVETARSDLILNEKVPRITRAAAGQPRKPDNGGSERRPSHFHSRVKKIMYLSSVYRLDRMVYMARPFSTTLLDWQARLLCKLRDSGYALILKAHPDSLFPPPDFFRKEVPAHVEALRFEQVADQADLLLFDNPLSTAFAYALKSTKPIVLIDFGLTKFTERGRQLLERRCAILEGRTDDRWQVDWSSLEEAIRGATRLTDSGFVETYLLAA